MFSIQVSRNVGVVLCVSVNMRSCMKQQRLVGSFRIHDINMYWGALQHFGYMYINHPCIWQHFDMSLYMGILSQTASDLTFISGV